MNIIRAAVIALSLAPVALAQEEVLTEQDSPEAEVDQGAQPAGRIQSVPDRPLRPRLTIDVNGGYAFRADIDSTDGGSVAKSNVNGDVSLQVPVNQRFGLSFRVSGGAIFYDFDGPSGLFAGDSAPWQTIEYLSFGIGATYAINYDWRVFGSFNVSSAGESGTDFDETWTVGGTAAVAYVISDRLTIGVGITVQTRLDDNIFIIPFPSVEWTIDEEERWKLTVGGARLGPSRSAGIAISYKATDTLTILGGWAGFGLGGDFRLDDSGPAPGGVGRDTSFPILVGVDWRPDPDIRVTPFAGVALFGELELLDSNGNRIAKRRVDPQFVLGLGVSISF